jgi:hypothetical protein
MGDPQAPPLRVERLLRALDDHGVRYVIVGGLAAAAQGAGRVTFDIDVVPEWSTENLDHLADSLRSLHAELRWPDGVEPVPVPLDAKSLRGFEVSTWRTDAGDVDVIIGTPTAVRGRLAGYDDLVDRGHRLEAYGLTVIVADLSDIIESKQVLAREPDLAALPELRRLQARLAAKERTDES